MTTRLRTVLVGALLTCGALATAVGVATHDGDDRTPAQTAALAAPRGPYVALGDSYTAGPMIPGRTGTPVGCARSDHNYPSLVARRLGLDSTDFRDMSCTGATITDLTSPQRTAEGMNAAQFTALSDRTRLVTLGIGGNDIGFGTMIERCVGMGAAYHALGSGKYIPDDTPCERLYSKDGTDRVQRRIDAVGGRLTDALKDIESRAPEARVYVVGYPAVLPADSTDCEREMPLAPGDMIYLREKEQQLNDVLRERAEAEGAVYVDTYTVSEGHDACAAEDTRWIEPLVPSSPAAAVHPNARGEEGMADAVLHALGTTRHERLR
ncbi:SGNH/GDSL hydrolase family protein [Streptomyces sp. SP17KL33]|uniref:SGNH/GDSL hydrolase family protein n=1 Tax=Streptomyces sp. SP17KL33 TaxID=3002534 RepID=UPI002E7981E8|nr:SGNH/GDSL hydrolase family protein [Streptomyces sp. SP17KL33]MEE1833720.1 SGNH/GDSL hydrolase family protein [Streptomyces sp. SP17KL33]